MGRDARASRAGICRKHLGEGGNLVSSSHQLPLRAKEDLACIHQHVPCTSPAGTSSKSESLPMSSSLLEVQARAAQEKGQQQEAQAECTDVRIQRPHGLPGAGGIRISKKTQTLRQEISPLGPGT